MFVACSEVKGHHGAVNCRSASCCQSVLVVVPLGFGAQLFFLGLGPQWRSWTALAEMPDLLWTYHR
jgi:hypothetical protein